MRTRVVASIWVACLVLAGSATAATTRYVTPNGEEGPSECKTKAEACDFSYALNLEVEEGDTVIVEPGNYAVPDSGLGVSLDKVRIEGDPSGQMPKLIYSPPPESFIAALTEEGVGDSISYLEVEATDPDASGFGCPGSGRLERVRAVNPNGGTAIAAGGACEITDSLAIANGKDATGIFIGTFFGPSASVTATIKDSTAIASGSGALAAIYASTLESETTYDIEISNTIAAGVGLDLKAAAPGPSKPLSIHVDHSNFDAPEAAPGTSIIEGPGNQKAPPLFVNAATGNYAEAPGSPTIEAGVALANPPALDLAGAARVQGASIDIGAFETSNPPPTPPQAPPTILPPPPVISAPAPSVSNLKVTPTTFRALNAGGSTISTAATKPKKAPVGATVTYTLNTAATVTFTVARKTTGRKVGGKCVAVTKGNEDKKKCPLFKPVKGSFDQAGAAGSNSFKFSGRIKNKELAPGAYRLTATAGASSASANFTIVE